MLNGLQAATSAEGKNSEVPEVFQKPKAELLVAQKYSPKEGKVNMDSIDRLMLTTEKEAIFEWLELNKPRNMQASKVSSVRVCLRTPFFSANEEIALAEMSLK